MAHKSLVGPVVERKSFTSREPPKATIPNKSGFPIVQHRSRSAFARSTLTRNQGLGRTQGPPSINGSPRLSRQMQGSHPNDWMFQISEENRRRVEAMTEEEREEAKREILDRFGPEIGSILKRVKEARGRGVVEKAEGVMPEKKTVLIPTPVNAERDISPPGQRRSVTRPPSRVRFAELQPQNVHVYESAPPSPRKKALALPPPPTDDESVLSLGRYVDNSLKQAKSGQTISDGGELEEGTPEFIRQHYFPEASVDDPGLEWLRLPLDSSQTTLRFDLSGNPIRPDVGATIPTHFGLHHHAEGHHAGYTLDDIFLLSRSTVPAQRATMLGILARIAKKVARMRDGGAPGLEELVGKVEQLRKQMLAAGLEALNVRGSVGVRAIELVWACIVQWDERPLDVQDVELQSHTDGVVTSIPFEHFLPQIATIYGQGDAAPASLLQLLALLHRLAQENNEIATQIVATPKLISNVVRTHLMTLSSQDTISHPEPAAVELLIILALSSRSNAQAVVEYADALLRFIAILPPNSPFPILSAIALLTSTLRFYTALGAYGLYAHIASTAMTQLMDLERYINSSECVSQKLFVAWADLLSVWMTCAVDPHRTTPPHDILWSRVTNFSWSSAILGYRNKLDVQEYDREVWGALWRAESAWLEGCRINAIRGGEEERAACVALVKEGFSRGKERRVVEFTLDGFRQRLVVLGASSFDDAWRQSIHALNGHANILAATVKFWVSCTPPLSDGPLSSPPFLLPFSRISDLCEQLVRHTLWQTAFNSGSYTYALVRPLASLLLSYLGLSRRLPDTTQDFWVAQALSIITRLLPGHEEFALDIITEVLDTLNVEWLQSKGYDEVSAQGGFDVIKPFLAHTLQPKAGVYVSPSLPTAKSIALATTQRLPQVNNLGDFGLPPNNDWTFVALDHLLRSGSSSVLKTLPEDWSGSEVEVVRASLLLSQATRDILEHYSMDEFSIRREEAVFNCMKVFMLEHEQTQGDTSVEVFRDAIVTRLMDNLLQPYSFGQAMTQPSQTFASIAKEGSLETAASRFLGSSTPFFQYYTDFVALYDAISFAHPLFARLLLPPISMRYAVDYRQHLWGDFGHVVKTIRTPVEEVVTADIREYLYPVENNAQMLHSYLRALLNDATQEFLQLIAVHHVASNIWPDLIEENLPFDEGQASSLLKAIVEQGPKEVVRKVVTYRQTKDESAMIPPSCYEAFSTVKKSRLDCVKRWERGTLVARLQGLFA